MHLTYFKYLFCPNCFCQLSYKASLVCFCSLWGKFLKFLANHLRNITKLVNLFFASRTILDHTPFLRSLIARGWRGGGTEGCGRSGWERVLTKGAMFTARLLARQPYGIRYPKRNPVSKKKSGFHILGLLRYSFTEIYIANQQTRIKSEMTKDYFGE